MNGARERIECPVSGRGTAHVEFAWVRDRFQHRVVFETETQAPIVLESLEGQGEERWPPSPPLQQLTCETHPAGRRVALLVGMAGSSHWSLSLEPLPDRPGFSFDAACRWRERPEYLGSTYRLGHSDTQLVPGCDKDFPLSVVPQPPAAPRVEFPPEGLVRVRAELLNDAHQPVNTTRWRYVIEF